MEIHIKSNQNQIYPLMMLANRNPVMRECADMSKKPNVIVGGHDLKTLSFLKQKNCSSFTKITCKTSRFMLNYNGAWRIDRVAKEPDWKSGKV